MRTAKNIHACGKIQKRFATETRAVLYDKNTANGQNCQCDGDDVFFSGHDKKYYKKIDEGVDIDLVVCYTTTVKPKTAGFCKSVPLSCRGESSVFTCAFYMFKAL